VADNGNVDTIEGFERVDRTPNDTPPPFVTPPPVVKPPHDDASTRPVTIRGGIVRAIKGTVSIRVSCPASSPGNCTGTLTLHTARGATVAGRTVAVRVGSTRYNVAPGVSKTLKVKLANGSRRLADRKGHIKVLVISSTSPPGKIAQISQRVTVAIGAAKRS